MTNVLVVQVKNIKTVVAEGSIVCIFEFFNIKGISKNQLLIPFIRCKQIISDYASLLICA